MGVTVYICTICNKVHIKKFVITKMPKDNTNAKQFCSIECAVKFLRECHWKAYNIDGDRPEIEQLLVKLNLPDDKKEESSHDYELEPVQ